MNGTNRTFHKIGAIVVVVAVFLSSSLACAQSYDPEQDIPQPTMLQKRMNKLGRGLSNFFFGWTEIPVTWNQKMKQGKPLTYLFTTAPVLGTTKMFMRMGTGAYEFLTFYSRNPSGSYDPILEPEYIF
ncbi:MAG: exosortase system-associated protein, TIGR04073 family [Candidatus Hydrogenedentes bacterium]|nr:exosortase system-associated protein, TIGR04073 family [Candidatus Hydrogenedentota bacterium]MDK1022494.1 exosortase system-associated protein, TIGR04073 family [Candidatus Hydrogenedentota bacterium]